MIIEIKQAIEVLEELIQDEDASKKVKEKAQEILKIIKEEKELAIEKALIELEELSSIEMPSFQRTKVWDVVSLLESALYQQ